MRSARWDLLTRDIDAYVHQDTRAKTVTRVRVIHVFNGFSVIARPVQLTSENIHSIVRECYFLLHVYTQQNISFLIGQWRMHK